MTSLTGTGQLSPLSGSELDLRMRIGWGLEVGEVHTQAVQESVRKPKCAVLGTAEEPGRRAS